MASTKLTPAQRAQLGGFGRWHGVSKEERSAAMSKLGQANFEKNGREGMIRAAHIRHGRLTSTKPAGETTGSKSPKGEV